MRGTHYLLKGREMTQYSHRKHTRRKRTTRCTPGRAPFGFFVYQTLECRRLLASPGDELHNHTDLIEVSFEGLDVYPVIVAGDPNGNPPSNPNTIIDPDVPTSPYSGVVSFNPVSGPNSAICSGTLLDDRHILTAGHCVDFSNNGVPDISLAQSSVIFNHQGSPVTYTGLAGVWAHPDYNGFGNPNINDDIAIVRLNQDAPAAAVRYPVSQVPYNMQTNIALAGYGDSGTGTQGYTVNASFFVKRRGQNRASGFTNDDEGSGLREVFRFDFDGPTGTTNTLGDGLTLGNNTEVHIGGGDSGGPSFLWNDANSNTTIDQGELTVFGVNTYITSFGAFQPPFFGSQGGGMAVASYLDFIDDYVDLDTEVTVNVNVASVNIVRGFLYNGFVSDMNTSNNSYYSIVPGPIQNPSEAPVWLEMTGTSPELNPLELGITLEARVSSVNILQKVEAFNYDTGLYETVHADVGTMTDSVVNVSLTGDLARFVNNANNQMKTRLTWKDFGIILVDPWLVHIDQHVWMVTYNESSPSPPLPPGGNGSTKDIRFSNVDQPNPNFKSIDSLPRPTLTQSPAREQVVDQLFASTRLNLARPEALHRDLLRESHEFEFVKPNARSLIVDELESDNWLPVEILNELFE
jgi:hypothetical protein